MSNKNTITNLEIIPQTCNVSGKVYYQVAQTRDLNKYFFIAFIEKILGLHVVEGRSFDTRKKADAYLAKLKMKRQQALSNEKKTDLDLFFTMQFAKNNKRPIK